MLSTVVGGDDGGGGIPGGGSTDDRAYSTRAQHNTHTLSNRHTNPPTD